MSDSIGCTVRPVIFFFIREEPYGFLSNFERTGFHARPSGLYSQDDPGAKQYWYPTNEHFYQSQKALTQEIHDDIVSLSKATLAMELGRALERSKHLQKYCKPHWRRVMLMVMLTGIRHKFKTEPLSGFGMKDRRKIIQLKLINTGDAILHENNPDDPFWGLGDGTGDSWLGKLLMIVREECKGWSCPVDGVGYMLCHTDGGGRDPPEDCPVKDICYEMAEYHRMAERNE